MTVILEYFEHILTYFGGALPCIFKAGMGALPLVTIIILHLLHYRVTYPERSDAKQRICVNYIYLGLLHSEVVAMPAIAG